MTRPARQGRRPARAKRPQLNQRPPVCETGALPAELSARVVLQFPAMDSNHHIEIQNLAACRWPSQEWRLRDSNPRGPEPSRLRRDAIASRRSRPFQKAPEGNRTPVASLEDWCLGPLGHWSIRAVSRQPTAVGYQLSVARVGAWTGSATGGAGETRTHKTEGPAVFGTASSSSRIRSSSGGADSNRLLGGHIPALSRVSYRPELRGTGTGSATQHSLQGSLASLGMTAEPVPRSLFPALPAIAGAGLEPASRGL